MLDPSDYLSHFMFATWPRWNTKAQNAFVLIGAALS